MLFDCRSGVVESDKERNLSYKFFAGYFFNELIQGYEKRLKDFHHLICNTPVYAKGQRPPCGLCPSSTHVSFDVRAYLMNPKGDNGEFADVLLYDDINRAMIAIEVKFLQDWTFKKDVEGNARRLAGIVGCNAGLKVIQRLLLKEEKWTRVRQMQNHSGSQFSKLQADTNISMVVITWEQLVLLCDDPSVRAHLERLLRMSEQQFRLWTC